MGPNAKAALIALVAFGLYATHDVFVKMLGGTFTPFQIIFFSTLLSFPLVLIGMMHESTSGNLRPVHPWWMALRTLCTLATGICAFYAFTVLPLAQVYAILFATPLLITVLSIPVLGEKVGPHRWGAVIVGLAGVMVVLQPGATEFKLGHLAALVAAVGSATSAVIVRKIGREERSAVLLLYPMIANFLLMAAVLPWVYVPPELVELSLFAAISVLGLLGGVLVIVAYRVGDAAMVAPMQYSQILWAALYGAILFDERPVANTWLGAAIIIASGVYIVAREARKGVSENTPVTATKGRTETGTTPRVTAMRGLPGRASLGLQNRS